MRTQNRSILLERAIRSVCAQTLSDWELLIINDGGDAAAVEQVIASIPAPQRAKVRCLHFESPLGRSACLNSGLREISAPRVLVHDDDQSLHRDFLARANAFLKHPPHFSVKGVVTGTEQVVEALDGDTIRTISHTPYNDWLRHISLRRLLAGNVFAPIAFLFDREAALQVGGFDERLPVLNDWEFNVRFLSRHEIAVIPDILACHHIRADDGDADNLERIHQRQFFDNLLRNEWLREDIRSGRTGAGVIANEARMLRNLTQKFKKRSLRLFKKD
jgi:glycosyltransferase involved in cell wall biosynthesis